MASSTPPPASAPTSNALKYAQWETKEGIKKIADFLRGRKGMPVRHAVELGKRVEYFKGDKLATFLMDNHAKKTSRHCPPVLDKLESMRIGRLLVSFGYIHRSDRDSKNKKTLTPSRNHSFTGDGYYTWMYDGPKTLRNVLTAGIIIACIAFTCFPIWPYWAKIGVWYLSVTFLIFMFIFSILRLLAFLVCWICGMSFWFLPNIFDDDLGVYESFQPLYSLEKSGPEETYYRIATAIGCVSFCVWVYNQPTEFDEYVEMTKQFTDDIYSGKLLDEISEMQRKNMDKMHVPALEDFMKEDEDEVNADAAKKEQEEEVDEGSKVYVHHPQDVSEDQSEEDEDAFMEKLVQDDTDLDEQD